MKRIFKRVGYLLKAKGRHGTHSPFVYAFVEQVMRRKTKFKLSKPSLVPGNFSKKEINLLGRALQYIDPEIVYVDHILLPFIKALVRDNDALTFEVESIYKNEKGFKSGGLFFCLPTEECINEIKPFFAEHFHTAIIPYSHFSKPANKGWADISSSEYMKMVIDTWYFGFVSNHPDFKIKQYFALR